MILPFTRQNFLSREEISCHRKKVPVTGRNFVPQEEISCLSKKFLVMGRKEYFLSQEEISCPGKTYSVTGRVKKQKVGFLINRLFFPMILDVRIHQKKIQLSSLPGRTPTGSLYYTKEIPKNTKF